MSATTSRPRPVLNRRRAARFAAVQALYQLEAGDGALEEVVLEFRDHRLRHLLEAVIPEVPAPEVDVRWFEIVVVGAWNSKAELDPAVEGCLSEGWSLARCGYLLRACLRAGSFELARRPDVPLKVVIDEYVELAYLFFSGDEPALVNAVLDRLSRLLRDPATA